MKEMEEMKDRIKKIRKEQNLTQQQFVKILGVSRSNLAGYESGTRVPSDAAISLICSKFNVNERWLRTGEGEMAQASKPISLDDFVKQRGASEIELAILKAYFDIDLDTRRKILNRFRSCFVDNKDPSDKPEESGE